MLCGIAKEANEYVAGWMSRQPAVKEESITDWLLDFFHQKSSDIFYYQFNRHEEARFYGADWDWWFLLPKGCFKVRVQAKKLKKGKNHYRDLARSNQSGLQIDMLLKSSTEHNFYPIYSIYGFTEGISKCQKVSKPAVLSICSAQDIYELMFGGARKRIDSSDVSKLTIPLPCLFCCPLVKDDPSRGPEELFNKYFGSSPRLEGERESEGHSRGYEESVNPIILSLFEMRGIDDNKQGILKEYQSIFDGSNGVVIVKLNENVE